MLEEFFLYMNRNRKVELAKYAAVFVGGIIVGYSAKKALDG